MKKKSAIAGALLLASVLAIAAAQVERATVVRDTELHADSQSDSATLAQLPAESSVEVLQRRGAWDQVKARNQTGWVRMLNLKLESAGGGAGSGGINFAAMTGRTSNSATETNAVKGMNTEDIQNAAPNTAAVAQMQTFALTPAQGQDFSQKAHLSKNQVAYLTLAK